MYEIDRIVDRKLGDNNNYLYRVRWKGYGAGHDSWRSLDELTDAVEAVADYEGKLREAEEPKEVGKGEEKDNIPNGKDEDKDGDEDKEASKKNAGKVARFADNVEKSEQRIVGGNWQTVFEQLKG